MDTPSLSKSSVRVGEVLVTEGLLLLFTHEDGPATWLLFVRPVLGGLRRSIASWPGGNYAQVRFGTCGAARSDWWKRRRQRDDLVTSVIHHPHEPSDILNEY